MYYILYNPLSCNGKSIKYVNKLKKLLKKKHEETKVFSLLDYKNKEIEFLESTPFNVSLVIVGGDGTIHYVLNVIKDYKVKQRIFFYSAGRGNDYSRGHKNRFFEITDEIKKLPRIYFNDTNYAFINGIGMGIDSRVCELMEEYSKSGKKSSYYKVAVKAFKTFKPFSLDLKADGVDYHFDGVWFFVVMNGKYMGGGMKVAPYALRDDDHYDIYVIHLKSLGKLLRRFPFIFIGKHIWFKKDGITEIFAKKIEGSVNGYSTLQRDGEISYNVKDFRIE